jgi:putative flavoprotein involved in K+ transport
MRYFRAIFSRNPEASENADPRHAIPTTLKKNAMRERHDIVVIGGGQAGLAISYLLRQRGRQHLILERHRVAERWYSQRWDSLCFQFPNWSLQLPGYGYAGNEPDGFAHRNAVIRFIEDYAHFIEAPIRCGVEVTALEHESASGRFLLRTADALIEASCVVIATGPYQRPSIPYASAALPSDVFQIHASHYREPAQLPPGAILIVGSGSSGCQIAEELRLHGRTIYLSVGRHRIAPRRYRGHDLLWWFLAMGKMDTTIDSLPSRRLPPPILFTGVDGGHDISLRHLAADGVHLLGGFRGIEDGKLMFLDNLDAIIDGADKSLEEFKRAADGYVQTANLKLPEDSGQAHRTALAPLLSGFSGELDWRARNVRTVIWCTGYRGDFDWVHLPVFDDHGVPRQRRGVTDCPGAYFLGLHWMYKQKSSALFGVGEDAAYLADIITAK